MDFYIDAHTHLPNNIKQCKIAFDRIKKYKVQSMVVSVDVPSYLDACKIASENELIKVSFGIHPNHASEYINRLEEIEEYLLKAVYIGEIGLCKLWASDFGAQQKVFLHQLAYAYKAGKSVNIHSGGCEWEIIKCLKKYMPPAVLIHWYSGSLEGFLELASMGCYFSFGVNMIAKSLDNNDPVKSFLPITKELLKRVRKDRILTETDGADAREWIDLKPSYADSIIDIVKAISVIQNTNENQLKNQIYENYMNFIYVKKG